VRINDTGRIVASDDDRANMCDKIFNSLAADDSSITLADFNVRDKDGKAYPFVSGDPICRVVAADPAPFPYEMSIAPEATE
jgi:hypothetical protein